MLPGDTAEAQGTAADPDPCDGDSIETECAHLRVVAEFEQENTLTAATISAAATMLEEQGVCCLQGVLDVEVAGESTSNDCHFPNRQLSCFPSALF